MIKRLHVMALAAGLAGFSGAISTHAQDTAAPVDPKAQMDALRKEKQGVYRAIRIKENEILKTNPALKEQVVEVQKQIVELSKQIGELRKSRAAILKNADAGLAAKYQRLDELATAMKDLRNAQRAAARKARPPKQKRAKRAKKAKEK